MNKKISILLLLVLILSNMVGCIKKQVEGEIQLQIPNEEKQESDMVEPNVEERYKDNIKEKVDEMTLDEKIGQMVLVGFEGYTVNDATRRLIEDYHVGGFILFERNIRDVEQLVDLLNELKNINTVNKMPLFISTDEEGGRVSRMPKEFKKLPPNKTIGDINNGDFSFEIGSIIGEELKGLGLNMDFAPVLDINSNPNNPVIGSRSFGDNIEIVTKLGIRTMEGIASEGIIPVIKHFPGHGDTSVDSHLDLPCINNDLERLQDLEFVPFKEAIDNGADVVMVAHILFSQLDEENPASLSKTIITDILRDHMEFDGVVITDDMTMGAIVDNYGMGEAAVKSIVAGTDIVLICHQYENQISAINAIKTAVKDGTISEERIDESVYRILSLKDQYKLDDGPVQSIDVKKINERIDNTLNKYIK